MSYEPHAQDLIEIGAVATVICDNIGELTRSFIEEWASLRAKMARHPQAARYLAELPTAVPAITAISEFNQQFSEVLERAKTQIGGN